MKVRYKCTECGREYSTKETHYLCEDCGATWKPGTPLKGVLETIFDYEYIGKHFDKENPDWNLFSAVDKKYFPDYPVGNTPFFPAKRVSNYFQNVFIKFDGLNPSGSLKDRASFMMVAEANRLGKDEIVCASTGNAASALASVCASAGIKAKIFVPKSAPIAKRIQMKLCGAEVVEVDGTYDDAFRLSTEFTEKYGTLNRNTAYHPLTIEGKKTVALEIFAQNNFIVPDWILVPVGDGVIISGVYKGFLDLKRASIIDHLPKLVAVQAEKSDAIHQYIITGKYADAKNPDTIADSISVTTPSNAKMAKKAVEDSNGFSITVTDDEIMKAQYNLSRLSGIFAEPAASAPLAGLNKLENNGRIAKDDQIVLLVTGHGLKDIEAAKKNYENID